MNFDEMQEAVRDAERLCSLVDTQTTKMLSLLVGGRLRYVSGWKGMEDLCRLKRELKNFNAQTLKWKD